MAVSLSSIHSVTATFNASFVKQYSVGVVDGIMDVVGLILGCNELEGWKEGIADVDGKFELEGNGDLDGRWEGATDKEGVEVGNMLVDGLLDGRFVGGMDGDLDGMSDGFFDGFIDGSSEGPLDGDCEGISEG